MSRTLYRIYYAFLVTMMIIAFASGELMLGKISLKITLFVVILCGLFGLLSLAPLRIRLASVGALCVGLCSAFMLSGVEGKKFVAIYFNTAIHSAPMPEEYSGVFSYIQCALVTLLVCFIVLLFDKIRHFKYVFAIGCAVCVIAGHLMHRGLSRYFVALFLLFFVSIWVEWIQLWWKKRSSNDTAGYFVWLIPFLLVYYCLLMILPISEEPYSWKYAKAAYQLICENVTIMQQNFGMSNQEDFDTTMAGFSDSSDFFGNISDSDRELMTIEGDKMLITNLYLSGRSYDVFSGQGWEQSFEETGRDKVIDMMEILYGVRCYDGMHQKNYINPATFKLKFGRYHSKHTFLPLKATKFIDRKKNRDLYFDEGVLYGKKRGYGAEYSVEFYQLNVDHSVFYEMLEAPHTDDEVKWKELSYRVTNSEVNFAKKREYDDLLRQRYSEEIVLSEEMKEWVREMTEGAKTPVQRLKMLELALSQLEYSKTPGALPEEIQGGADYLDYFILQKRKGYCTYYATAFTLLARAEGFPARYVEGFCVPVKKGKAVVKSTMAHAWPEVYFDGLGWIPFEPTPGYDVFRYTPWEVKTESASGNEVVNARYWEKQTMSIPEKMQTLPVTEEVEKTKNKSFLRILRIFGIVILFLAVLIAFERVITNLRYQRLCTEQKYLFQYKRTLRLLAFLGLTILPGETIKEFDDRVKEFSKKWQEEECFRFLSDYESYRYGNIEITEEMLQRIVKEQERLLSHIRFRIGYFCIKE